MSQSTFFLLDRPIPAVEIESFLCRVVVSVTSPLAQFAPFSLPGTPSHNTDDIIPSILPEPSLSVPTKTFRAAARGRGMAVNLTNLASVNVSRSEEQSRTLESESMKCYELRHHKHYFQELMKNDDYSRDVRTLLREIRPRHAYLVTGFYTTTKSAWKIDGSRNREAALKVTLPISAAVPAPVGGLVDIGGGLSGSSASQRSDERFVAEEEIFAVSYSIVQFSYRLLATSKFFIATPSIGPPKRAKDHHLTLGRDEEEDEGEEAGEEIDWDSDDAVEHFKAGSIQTNQDIDMEVIISGMETDDIPLTAGDGEVFVMYE